MRILLLSILLALASAPVGAQNVGIGTTVPQQRLHVNGNIRTDSALVATPVSLTPNGAGLASTNQRASVYRILDNGVNVANTLTLTGGTLNGHVAYVYNGDAQALTFGGHSINALSMGAFVYDGTAWRRADGGAAAADNLGNHIATQNIQLNNNWLSNDGGNEGIRVDNQGYVGVGLVPAHPFHVYGQTTGSVPVTDASYTGAAIQQSGHVGGYLWAQSFTAMNTGSVTSITVRLRSTVAGGVTAVLDFYNGNGCGGALVATSSTMAVPNTNAPEDVNFTFPAPPAIAAGSVYTFRIRLLTGLANGFVYWNSGSAYAGGQAFDQSCNPRTDELRFTVFANGSGPVAAPLVWTTNPHLGVGTLSPTERLQVAGNSRLQGTLSLEADTLVHPSGGSFTPSLQRSVYLVKTTAAPAAATLLGLPNGAYPGQMLVLISRNTGTNGFRLTEAGSNAQLSAATVDLDLNDSISLVWNGQDWVQTALSANN